MTISIFTVAERSRVDTIFTEGQEETDSFNVTLNGAYGRQHDFYRKDIGQKMLQNFP